MQYIFREFEAESKADEKQFLNKTRNAKKALEMFSLFLISKCHQAFEEEEEKKCLELFLDSVLILVNVFPSGEFKNVVYLLEDTVT